MDEDENGGMSHRAMYGPVELRCRVCGRRFTDDFVQLVPDEEDRWDLPDRVWACIKWPECPGKDKDILEVGNREGTGHDAYR